MPNCIDYYQSAVTDLLNFCNNLFKTETVIISVNISFPSVFDDQKNSPISSKTGDHHDLINDIVDQCKP